MLANIAADKPHALLQPAKAMTMQVRRGSRVPSRIELTLVLAHSRSTAPRADRCLQIRQVSTRASTRSCLTEGMSTDVRRPVRSRAPLSRPTAVLSCSAQLNQQQSGQTPQAGQQRQGMSRGGEQERCGRRQRRRQPFWSVPWMLRQSQAAKAVGDVRADARLQWLSWAARAAQQYALTRFPHMCVGDSHAPQKRSPASCRPRERPGLQGHEQHREQERTVLQGASACFAALAPTMQP